MFQKSMHPLAFHQMNWKFSEGIKRMAAIGGYPEAAYARNS